MIRKKMEYIVLALNKLLSEVHYRIPRQILDAVFIDRNIHWRDTPPSIDDQIMALVIRPRVLVDCDLVGGIEAFINLNGVPFQRSDDYTSVYRIPKKLTNNRSINSVLNITFSDPSKISSYGVAAGQQNTMMLQLGSAVMDAHGSIPVTSTAKVQLIGENVVMIRDTVILPANIYLRCILANDEHMSHIQLRSYPQFAELGVLAVKSYIYNEYSIQMDIGQLLGGMAIGKFKEIVDSYADSDELYRVFLNEKWRKIALMSDNESFSRMLKMIVGGSR